MTTDQLRAHITAVPFTPFHVRTADGRRLQVSAQDLVRIAPSQSHVFVFQPDGSHTILNIGDLAEVEVSQPQSGGVRMATDELRRYVMATPFRPFVLNVADGRRVPVVGRDFILISPMGQTLHIYQYNGSFEVLDNSLVTGISFDAPLVEQPVTRSDTAA